MTKDNQNIVTTLEPTEEDREKFKQLMHDAVTDEEFMEALYVGMEDPNDPAYNEWLRRTKPVVLLERKTEYSDNF